jgi:ABC-type dipeptide/oligopeptide/nickel transport system ATPase subunit
MWVSSFDQIAPVFPETLDSRVSRTFWKIFLTKSRENKNGIIFLDHKFSIFKAIERSL